MKPHEIASLTKDEAQHRAAELEACARSFIQFLDSLPAGWLGKTCGDIGILNQAYIQARTLGLLDPERPKKRKP